MKKMLAILVAVAIAVGAVVPALALTETASACENGLSPGYWKNHTEVWDGTDPCWHGPNPDAYFDEVFGIVGCKVGVKVGRTVVDYTAPHMTLLEVLRTGGGKFDAFNRAAVAALLNSYWIGDYFSTWHVKNVVVRPVYGIPCPAQHLPPGAPVFSKGDWESAKTYLENSYD